MAHIIIGICIIATLGLALAFLPSLEVLLFREEEKETRDCENHGCE